MDWLGLGLLSAFSLASADACTKKYLHDYSAANLVLIRFSLTGLLLGPVLVFAPLPAVPPVFWLWVGAAVPLELLAMLLYMRAIRHSPLALTLPYLAFTPVYTVVTGFVLLGERVSATGMAGVLLVVAGAYLLNLPAADGDGHRQWLEPLKALYRERGARLMLAVAFIYSLTSVLGKGALQYAPPLNFAVFYNALLGAAAALLLLPRRPQVLTMLRARPGPPLLVAALMGVMVLTHFAAIARIETAYMIAVKRTSLLFGILYGAWLFREPGLRRHLAAGLLMVGGIALIGR